jgi:hypothetical protein
MPGPQSFFPLFDHISQDGFRFTGLPCIIQNVGQVVLYFSPAGGVLLLIGVSSGFSQVADSVIVTDRRLCQQSGMFIILDYVRQFLFRVFYKKLFRFVKIPRFEGDVGTIP